MKKILCSLFVALAVLSGCDTQTASPQTADAKETINKDLADNKIYFFYYNECPYCHLAIDYMNKNYPNLDITMINIHNPGGYELIVKAAKKYKLGRNVGTPLFAMGKNYIMGWDESSSPDQFKEYVKPFLK